jgi:hypothetical protein
MEEARHTFIFPKFFANWMLGVPRARLNLNLLISSVVLFIGLMGFGIAMFFDNTMLYVKVLIVFNCIAGILYMTSAFSNQYGEYSQERDIAEIQKNMREL